jgi:hypothetical protein
MVTLKSIVLSGDQLFAEGDLESLGKIFHENVFIKVNRNHKRLGEYAGFANW